MSRNVFLDLDGVMADFETHFWNLFECHPPSHGSKGVNDDTMWALIHDQGDFFETMPLFQGTLRFWRMIHMAHHGEIQPIILTAASKQHYHEMSIQKKKWVKKHLGEHVFVITTPGSRAKQLFIQRPGDILIDDHEKNCNEWTAAGGFAVHHTGDYDRTLNTVISIMEGRNGA